MPAQTKIQLMPSFLQKIQTELGKLKWTLRIGMWWSFWDDDDFGLQLILQGPLYDGPIKLEYQSRTLNWTVTGDFLLLGDNILALNICHSHLPSRISKEDMEELARARKSTVS
jgi:hypothetical protein